MIEKASPGKKSPVKFQAVCDTRGKKEKVPRGNKPGKGAKKPHAQTMRKINCYFIRKFFHKILDELFWFALLIPFPCHCETTLSRRGNLIFYNFSLKYLQNLFRQQAIKIFLLFVPYALRFSSAIEMILRIISLFPFISFVRFGSTPCEKGQLYMQIPQPVSRFIHISMHFVS